MLFENQVERSKYDVLAFWGDSQLLIKSIYSGQMHIFPIDGSYELFRVISLSIFLWKYFKSNKDMTHE